MAHAIAIFACSSVLAALCATSFDDALESFGPLLLENDEISTHLNLKRWIYREVSRRPPRVRTGLPS